MKTKLGALLAIVLAVALVLSGCTTPATPAAPAEPAAEAAQPTATPVPAVEAKTYVVATDAAFPPMEFVDANKNIVGFDIDLMNAIAKAMGFEVEYKNTAWDGIFAGLESGDYDAIISAVTIRDDRKAKYDFSEPYINAGQAIVVMADDTGDQERGRPRRQDRWRPDRHHRRFCRRKRSQARRSRNMTPSTSPFWTW